VIGERGARTRRQIVEAAEALFAERGFRATAVDDIARAADISRATLYQYFESKDHVFLELVEETGAQLNRRARTLGPLGPDAEGLANLRGWIEEWAAVFSAHSTIFVEWASVAPPWAPMQPRLGAFLERHAAHLSGRIDEAGFGDVDADVIAVLLVAVVERSLHLRHVHGMLGLEALVDGLAAAFQLTLFPDTPEAVLPRPAVRPRRTRRPTPPPAAPERFPGERPRTVAAVLRAGAELFAELGYAQTNVDDIVARAHVARGTFYKHFEGKQDLFAAVAEDALGAFADVCSALDDLDLAGPAAGVRAWLEAVLAFHRRYAGVLRTWTERAFVEPELAASGQTAGALITAALFDGLARLPAPPAVGPPAAAVMLMALLQQFPDRAAGTRLQPSDDQVLDAEALFVRRGLVGLRSP
jgi:AcrR family transcriptional regulator